MALGRVAAGLTRVASSPWAFAGAAAAGTAAGVYSSHPLQNASNIAMDAVLGDANADNAVLGRDLGFGSVFHVPHPIQAIGTKTRATAGAMLGAVAGGMIGASRGKMIAGIGAGIGGAIGGGIGFGTEYVGQASQAYGLLKNPVAMDNFSNYDEIGSLGPHDELGKAAYRTAVQNVENGYTSYDYPHSTMPYRQGATRTGLAVDGSMVFGQYNLRR